MRFPNRDVGFLENTINHAIDEERHDKNRVHELTHLMRSSRRSFDGYVFVCLARIRIFNPSKAPAERIVTDIDSAIIKVGEKKIIIELNESKNQKKGGERKAINEIRKNLVPVLNSNAKGYRVREAKGFGGKL